jgi:hypothetical protein
MRITLLLLLGGGIAFGQKLAFTSRAYLDSPVRMSSVLESKAFGFDSVTLRNDGLSAVRAVQFRIVLRNGEDEEVADERRVPMNLEHGSSKQVVLSLGEVEGLKQLAKSWKKTAALVILTIESVEFENGEEWHRTEQKQDSPFDRIGRGK